MCHQKSQVCLTAEEQAAAEESFSVYCKPVELYNILQTRALQNPSFLQRCLHYKIQAKHQRRIQITVSLSGAKNVKVQLKDVFPLHVLLGRPFADVTVAQNSSIYQISQAGMLTTFSELGNKNQVEANFVLPEIKKLANVCSSQNRSFILIRNAEVAGNCFWAKIPIDTFCSPLETCAVLCVGHQTEMLPTISLHPGVLEPCSLKQNCLTLHSGSMDPMYAYQLQVSVRAQEIGGKEKSPYHSYSYDDVPASLLDDIKRLRSGNVVFNYGYYNDRLQKAEVTEDFSCPFCLVKCASFKGLKYHLTSSHDLFHFEFEENEEYQAVNVSVRTDIEIFEVDPRLDSFFYCSKFRRHRREKYIFQVVSHLCSHVLESDSPEAAQEGFHDNYPLENAIHSSYSPTACPTDAAFVNKHNDNGSYKGEKLHKTLFHENQLSARHKSESFGLENRHAADCIEPVSSRPDTTVGCATTTQASTGNDCVQPVSESSLAPVTALQYPKTRKPYVKQANRRNRSLLQKRQFFHSHGYQPMALEEVLSDQDSEDEMDNDVADIEDRKRLDKFVKATNDEKQIMHLWNSFVRRQRVVADGHIPWACEAFSRLHGKDLVRAPGLLWCWRLLMIKFWNHALLDAKTMNNCNLILEGFQNENSDPKQSGGNI